MTIDHRAALAALAKYAADMPATHYSHQFTKPAIDALRDLIGRDEVMRFQGKDLAPKRGMILPEARFSFGDFVEKTKGSRWRGEVCGFYSTELTPIGYAIESHFEPGSVQVYPEAALAPWKP